MRGKRATRYAALGCAAIALWACDRSSAPLHDRLADLRRNSTAGVGTFTGLVRAREPSQPCRRSARGLAGVVVEVGLWDGSSAFYRDSITHEPPNSPDEPRFLLLASTVTDSTGRFRFADMPHNVGYAMRATPPNGSAWHMAWGETMVGVPEGGEIRDFPTLCLPTR